MNFKIIKQSAFTIGEGADAKKGVNYVVAHKGRALNISSLDFEADELKVNAEGLLSAKGDLEIVAQTYDDLGVTRQGLKIKPKMDLALSSF